MELEKLQAEGQRVFRSQELSRVHRERLLRAGFLQQVVRGWLISSSPGTAQGESTPWFASFWEFCARYCEERFSDDWHLSPEQSLLISAENTVIPPQVIIYSPKGANNTTALLFGTSLYDLKESQPPLIWRSHRKRWAPSVRDRACAHQSAGSLLCRQASRSSSSARQSSGAFRATAPTPGWRKLSRRRSGWWAHFDASSATMSRMKFVPR